MMRSRIAPHVAAALCLAIAAACSGSGGSDHAPPPATLALFAGAASPVGSIDAQGAAARFDQPVSVAVDPASGAFYVADAGNHTIRKVTPDGWVSTVAGLPGKEGFEDGNGSAARFRDPAGIAVAAGGIVYVVDRGNFAVRRIDAGGNVTTLAGGQRGTSDGPGRSASFYFGSVAAPALALDAASGLYVADGPSIRRITLDGVVSTAAGNPLQWQYLDGPALQARFGDIWGLAVDSTGNVYAAEGRIRKLARDGMVSTFLPLADDSSPAAHSIAIDAADRVYAADHNHFKILSIMPDGRLERAFGTGRFGVDDGPPGAGSLDRPAIALSGTSALVMVEKFESVVRLLDFRTGSITTIAGTPRRGLDDLPIDATGALARFTFISDLEAAPGGALYAAEGRIRRIGPGAGVTTLWPDLRTWTLSVDESGSVYAPVTEFCAEPGSRSSFPCGLKLYRVTPDGTRIVWRDFGAARLVAKALARLGDMFYMAVIDYAGRDRVLRFGATGEATDIWAGTAGGVAVASNGDVFVSDAANHVIRRIAPDLTTTLVAGTPGTAGSTDGPASVAAFDKPAGIALDGSGNLYVADSGNHLVRKVTPNGVVSTVAGTRGSRGFTPGSAPGVLDAPVDVAVVGDDLYIAMRTLVAVLRNRP